MYGITATGGSGSLRDAIMKELQLLPKQEAMLKFLLFVSRKACCGGIQ